MDQTRKASGAHQDRTFWFLVVFDMFFVINDMFLHILKLHTSLGTKMPSVGTKTRLYGILKVQNALIDLKRRLACLRTSQYTH